MVELVAPNGAVIQASDDAAPNLLANGFTPAKQVTQPKQAELKRRARKTAKTKG